MARIRPSAAEAAPNGNGVASGSGKAGSRARASVRDGERAGRRVKEGAVRQTTAKQPALTVTRPELLVDGSDRNFRRLVHGLFSFLARHEEIRDGHARTIGLAGIEYTVLISIAHLGQEGPVSITSVAQHLHFTGAFITNVCHRLLAQALIDKQTDPADRRRVVLTLTAEGRRRLEVLAPTQRQINDVEFGCLSRAEFAALLQTIERLVETSEKAVALQRYLVQGKQA